MKFDLNKLMKQAQQAQAKMQEAQSAIAQKTVEASVAAGKVVVKGTAAGSITSIKIDPSVVDPTDVELLEDLIITAIKQAQEEGQKIANAEMQGAASGLGLPPGFGL
jgi:hypothetical protein